jgi:hypothetical protein
VATVLPHTPLRRHNYRLRVGRRLRSPRMTIRRHYRRFLLRALDRHTYPIPRYSCRKRRFHVT